MDVRMAYICVHPLASASDMQPENLEHAGLGPDPGMHKHVDIMI